MRVVYALCVLTGFLYRAQIQKEEFYYEPPEWPINDPSITIGTVRPFVAIGDEELSFSAGAALTAFCQINFINKGLDGPKIKGHFNFKVYDSSSPEQTTQYYTLKLLENSLYNLSTKEPLIAGNNSEKLGILLHSSALGNARAGYGITSFYDIPYLDYGTLGGNGAENSLLQTSEFSNTDLYSSRLTQNFTIANAVFEILNYYNWTLVSSIFEQSAYGSYMLSIVQSMPEESNATFVCIKQTNSARLSPSNSFVTNFCSCVKSYDKIGVIVIWGQLNYANQVATSIKLQCSGFENTMFVVADDSDVLAPSFIGFSLQNSLWINSDSPSKYIEYLQRCVESTSDGSEKDAYLIQNFIDTYSLLSRGCTLYQSLGNGEIACNTSDITTEFQKDLFGVK